MTTRDALNAALHMRFGVADPCEHACTHYLIGSWSALGVANVVSRAEERDAGSAPVAKQTFPIPQACPECGKAIEIQTESGLVWVQGRSAAGPPVDSATGGAARSTEGPKDKSGSAQPPSASPSVTPSAPEQCATCGRAVYECQRRPGEFCCVDCVCDELRLQADLDPPAPDAAVDTCSECGVAHPPHKRSAFWNHRTERTHRLRDAAVLIRDEHRSTGRCWPGERRCALCTALSEWEDDLPTADDVSGILSAPDVAVDATAESAVVGAKRPVNKDSIEYRVGFLDGVAYARKTDAGSAPAEDDLRRLIRRLASSLLAVQGNLMQPYPDDPRWTPWTRFVEPDLNRLMEAAYPSQQTEGDE